MNLYITHHFSAVLCPKSIFSWPVLCIMFLSTHQCVTGGRGRGKDSYSQLVLPNVLSILNHHLSKAWARAAPPLPLLLQHPQGPSRGRGGVQVCDELLMKRQGLGGEKSLGKCLKGFFNSFPLLFLFHDILAVINDCISCIISYEHVHHSMISHV